MKILKLLIHSFLLSFVLFVGHANANPTCLPEIIKTVVNESSLSKGHFELAPESVQKSVLDDFLAQQKSGSFEKKIDPTLVRRVTSDDLQDLGKMSSKELKNLREEGLSHIDELAVVTSGAGLWSRGGGSVKALVPYNVAEILGPEFKKLSQAGKVVAAKTNEEILALSSIEAKASNVDKIAKTIKDDAMKTISTLLNSVTYDPRAINAIDMKFVNLAAIQEKTGKYVSLDIWTSEQTHSAIADYLAWLKNNYQLKIFHSDPSMNSKIKQALKKYFDKSKEMKETHLFGHQEGLYAVDVKGGNYKTSTVPIGKGAGAIVEYLNKTGRTKELVSMGKKTFVFENIEVVSDYAPLFASHRQAGKSVSVVLVPQKKGYVGGSPFLIKKPDGKWNLELQEMSVLSDEFKNGNEYFNSNTIFFSADSRPLTTIGFELKEQNTIARVKQNMGDITLDNPSHGIGGRVGQDQSMVEYENFKSYDEYQSNGDFYIKTFQNLWTETLNFSH